MLRGLGIVGIVLASVISFNPFEIFKFPIAIFLSFLGASMAWLSASAFFRGKAMVAASAVEVMARDPRQPVLYLRSFAIDDMTAKPTRSGNWMLLTTEEHQLAKALAVIGPVIAIGRPGEELPNIGAARFYVSDDLWQNEVSRLLSCAGLVIIRVGLSAGLQWEVERASQLVRAERIVFLLPIQQEQYDIFRTNFSNHLPCKLPELSLCRPGSWSRWVFDKLLPYGTICSILYFNSDWKPHIANLARPSWLRMSIIRPLADVYIVTFKPVFEQLGIPYEPPGLAWGRIIITVPVFLIWVMLALGPVFMNAPVGWYSLALAIFIAFLVAWHAAGARILGWRLAGQQPRG